MGVIRFIVHPEDLLDPRTDLQQAYISGFDGRVFPSRVELDGNVISFRRVNSDSAKVHLPYPVEGFGRPVISTASLRENDEPYILTLELARGKICQLRNQLAGWEALGMQIPDSFREKYRAAHHFFAAATIAKPDVAKVTETADKAIAMACHAADELCQAYVEQRLRIRFRRSPQLPVSFGCQLNSLAATGDCESLFLEAFNAVSVPIEWRKVEAQEGEYHWDLADALVDWAHENKLLVRGGPLIDLSAGGLPDWLQQWGQDFFNLQSFLCDFVETALSRYIGRVRLWEVSTRVNTGGAFNLSEEERLTLVAKTLEVARRVDEEAQLLIRIEEPWGAYQSRGQHRLSPLQFVDALLRCGIGLSGVNLEIAVGYEGRDCGPRDMLDTSRLIDQWSMLEIPLHVTLAHPAAGGDDMNCTGELNVGGERWKRDWSADAQARWIDQIVPLLMSKQSVIGIHWTHLSDSASHQFAHAGLIAADGTIRAGLNSMIRHRNGRTLDE